MSHGTLFLKIDGSFTYTPDANFNGTDGFVYEAKDDDVDVSFPATVSITVTNDAPDAVDDTATVAEDSGANTIDVLANDTEAGLPTDTLTITAVTQGTNGTVAITGGGTGLTYKPVADFNGSDSFTYTVNDGSGSRDTAAVDVTVTNSNDAPVAADDSGSTNEDVALPITVATDILGNDSDVDGDSLTVSAFDTTTAKGGGVTDNGDGTWTYTPAHNFGNADDTFTYTVSDGNGGFDTGTVTISVAPVNDAPVAADDSGSTNEDVALPITVATDILGNDSDVDGDSLTVSAFDTTTAKGGGVTDNGDGTWTYTPAHNFGNADDTFTYTVSDGNGGFDTGTVTISVAPVNDAPVAADDSGSTNEDVALPITVATDILGNDSDVDGDSLTVSAFDTTTAKGGGVTDNGDGTWTYTPAHNFGNADDTFTYTVSDGNGGFDTGTVTISVAPVNDAPVAADDSGSTNEDVALPITVATDILGNDSDVDGDSLTVSAFDTTTAKGGGVTDNGDGTWTYTPAHNFGNADDTFTYTVSDGNGGFDTGTVTISVAPVNDAPVAADDSGSTNEDVALPITVATDILGNDSDVDGDSLTVSAFDTTTAKGGGVTDNGDGTWTYTPAHNFGNADDTFTYTVSDGNGGFDTGTVTISVAPVNDAPVAADDSYSTAEDTGLTVSAPGVLGSDTDVDVDFLSAALVIGTTNGSLSLNADGSFSYTPNANFNGSDSFTYKANDGNLDSNAATVTITVNPVNDTPLADDDAYTTDEDTALTVSTPGVLGNDTDIDGDALTVASGSNPLSGTLTLNADGSFTYTPNANFNGSDSFTYTMSDGHGGSETAAVTITVNAVNDPPVAENNAATTDEDAAVTTVDVLGNDNDVEGDELSVISFDPTSTEGGTVTYNGAGIFTYTPPADFNGIDHFTYKATDGLADSNSADVTIQVYSVNDAPSFAGGGDQNAMENAGTQTVTAWATNIFAGPANESAQNLTFSLSNNNNAIFSDQPSIDPDNGTLTYTPISEGTATVTVVLRDNGGTDRGGVDQSAPQTFTITVTDSDPVAEIQYTITSDPPVEPMDVVFNDNTISYDGITRTWDFGDGITSEAPNPTHNYNHQGTYTVTLTVVEPDGDTDTATTSITVADAVPEADFLASPSAGPVPLVVAFENRTDTTAEKPDPLSVIIWDFGDGSTQTSVENPVHTYGTPGSYTVTLTVRDSDGSEDSASIIVTAEAVEEDKDADGDGWYISQGDCNDNNATINPGATEICGDGIDQDCFDGDRDCATLTGCIDLADTPLEVNTASGTANIMLAIDDSGSMDWEIMTTDGDDGLFWIGNDDYYYLYESDDNVNAPSVWPVLGKFDSNANKDEENEVQRRMWKAKWSGYNVIYYNPAYDYEPWYGESNADPNTPKAHPKQAGATPNLDLNATAFSLYGTDINYAHYYVWSASQNKPYLVELDGDFKYYDLTIDGSGVVTDLTPVTGAAVPDDIVSGRPYAEERQNFANWYSFYRKRWLATVAAMTKVIPNLSGVNLGWRTINGNSVQPVLPVRVTGRPDSTVELINKLKSFRLVRNPAQTPLRDGLDKIGLYFHMTETTGSLETELKVSPILTDGRGACQQNFVIIFTDGSWNGGAAGFNNVDGTKGAPYADDYPNTLADIAMYYYMNDLAPAVDDEVPINFVDKANWQHMVTYGVTFGVKGHLTPDDYVLYHTDPTKTVYPAWPDPLGSDADAKMAKIDDVWHAAVNGRGEYFSASNPEELAASLRAALNDIMARIGSGASVSVNGEEIDAGAVVYQSLYATEAWSGDVKAYSVDQATGEIQRDVPLWSAEEELESTDWDTGRIIATYDGTSGMPFRYDDSTVARRDQFALLDGNSTTAQHMVNYLRGDSSLEVEKGGTFRNRYVRLADNTMRDAKLGDIVHSSPFYQRYVKVDGTTEYGVLFVGGNDGMLHAFDAETGRERFSYVPRLVFENLKYLTQSAYSHKYYVDLTPTLVNTGSEAILIGGFGKGGKGYYALDMSDPDSITTEDQLADKVKWEYPRSSTPQGEIDDIGYSFSRASIAKSNDPAYPWIVVFGNGYQSANGNAVLFILNAIDGTLIRKIDTGVGGCNGLATPTLIDVNRDRKVDYAYAGDLKGNLWKFDLRASNAHGLAGDPGWEVAFYNGATPQPLFQARDGAGAYQPITVRPLVTKHPDSTKHGYLVLFGTGKYLGLSDFSNLQQQTVYGVWDYGDDSDDQEYLGSFNRDGLSNQPGTVSLLEQNVIYYGKPPSIGYYLRVLSNNEIVWNVQNDPTTGQLPNPHSTQQNHAGWYFDLPFLKERLVKEMYLRDNKLIFISSIPTTSPCAAGGESILHELDAATGGRLEEAQFDINNDKMINDADLLTITVTIDGVDVEIQVAPTGIHYPSVLYPPTILNAGETREVKLMSTAAGGIVDLWEAAENLGIYYWRQAH